MPPTANLRKFVVRLDRELLSRLDAAADSAQLSREGYVRALIENQLRPHGHRHTPRNQVRVPQSSRRERFSEQTRDRRVLRGRKTAKSARRARKPD